MVASVWLGRRAQKCGARGFVAKDQLASVDLRSFWSHAAGAAEEGSCRDAAAGA
jgi:hypothetical protein